MPREVTVYDDFSGGDFGRIEPWHAAKNQWTGTNMCVYRTGELGVRAGVRNVTPSGTVAGVVFGMGKLGTTARTIWYGQGTNIKSFDYTNPASLVTLGTVTAQPTGDRVGRAEYGDQTFIVTENSGAYQIKSGGVTQLTSGSPSPNGRHIALLGDRLVISPLTTQATIRYSSASDFLTWPAANAIAIGGDDLITALATQRSHLAILKQDSSYYVLTGVPGVNETLRSVFRERGPAAGSPTSYGVVRSNDMIWYVSGSEVIPSRFDGTKADKVERIITTNTGANALSVEPLRLTDPNALCIVQGAVPADNTDQRTWMYLRGVWTKHVFGVPVLGMTAQSDLFYLQDGLTKTTQRTGPVLCLTDRGTASVAPKFYTWMPDVDRPGTESNPFSFSTERAGDDSTSQVVGDFALRMEHVDRGQNVQVTGISVEFRRWNTGGSLTNHFDVTVDSNWSYESGTVTQRSLSWDEVGSYASSSGSLDTAYFRFGESGEGNAYQVRFTNCRGVAIQKIIVTTETTPVRF